ncbi:MAG: hypothetical protein HY747_00235 [Elusimicrobia bacterium]|nr:hypothetical protein [Elusimicrobiota bacterium]
MLVLGKQSDLAQVKSEQFWKQITPESLGFLRANIAPILRARSHADFKAMRFETEVVEINTALLSGNQDTFQAIQESLVTQISELPLTVNVVAREKVLIDETLQANWWCQPTHEKLRSLVERLAPLMRYRQQRRDPIVKLDIEDFTAIKEWIEFGPEHERLKTSVYRERIEAYVRTLANENPVLRKIQSGGEISEAELHELAFLLETQSYHITEEILRKLYDNQTAGFVEFMRHILGLERLLSWPEKVTQTFDDFITEHNIFSARQIQFLLVLKNFMIERRAVDRESLVTPPFTNFDPMGIQGVFPPPQVQEILTFVETIG